MPGGGFGFMQLSASGDKLARSSDQAEQGHSSNRLTPGLTDGFATQGMYSDGTRNLAGRATIADIENGFTRPENSGDPAEEASRGIVGGLPHPAEGIPDDGSPPAAGPTNSSEAFLRSGGEVADSATSASKPIGGNQTGFGSVEQLSPGVGDAPLGHQASVALARQLTSLRAGLDPSGLAGAYVMSNIQPPEGVDLFDFFESSSVSKGDVLRSSIGREPATSIGDLPRVPLADTELSSQVGSGRPLGLASEELRVAQMIQQMAAFGPSAGEGEWRDRSDQVQHRFEYFAAS